MGKTQNKLKAKTIQRTIKNLSVALYTSIVKHILLKSPEKIIRAISNAALNSCSIDVCFLPKLKTVKKNFKKK